MRFTLFTASYGLAFVREVEASRGRNIDSRRLHFMKRKHIDRWPLKNASDLDRAFAETLLANDAEVFQRDRQSRYHVFSASSGRMAVVQPDGRRTTIMPQDRDDLIADFGEPKWDLRQLVTMTSM